MPVTNSITANITIEYKESPKASNKKVSLLQGPRVSKSYDVMYISDRYPEDYSLQKVNEAIDNVGYAIYEAYTLFTKLGKTVSDMRLTISFTKSAYNEEYTKVRPDTYHSYWLCKSFAFNKGVVVRRCIPNSCLSTNSEGLDKHTEYEGTDLAKASNREKELLLRNLFQEVNTIAVASGEKE